MRGAEFSNFWWPLSEGDEEIADEALYDVAVWLGFNGERSYLAALRAEGPRILDRAKGR